MGAYHDLQLGGVEARAFHPGVGLHLLLEDRNRGVGLRVHRLRLRLRLRGAPHRVRVLHHVRWLRWLRLGRCQLGLGLGLHWRGRGLGLGLQLIW